MKSKKSKKKKNSVSKKSRSNSNLRRTLKQMKNKAEVGVIIGRGAFGCVIKPSINLNQGVLKINPDMVVSKILRNEDARLEIEILDDVKKVDPRGIYSTLMTQNSFLTTEIIDRQDMLVQRDINTCLNGKNTLEFSVINLIYVGNSLDNHFTVGGRQDKKSKLLRAEKRFITENFKDIFCILIEGLDHFHRNGVCLRDIKPENIAFGKHIENEISTLKPSKTKTKAKAPDNSNNFEFVHHSEPYLAEYNEMMKKKELKLSKGAPAQPKNVKKSKLKKNTVKRNSNNFQLVDTEEPIIFDKTNYCKYIDFGISINFIKDKRELLIGMIENAQKSIRALPIEEHLPFEKKIKKCNKDLLMQEIIHNPDFRITKIEEADILIQKLFTATLLYVPPEHYFLLMILVQKYPDLLDKRFITYNIINTITGGKPYSEDLIFLFIIKIMRRFPIFKEEDITALPEIFVAIREVPDLENQFFKGEFKDPKNVLYPLIIHQDYYALGLSLFSIVNELKIVNVKMLEIIRELCHVSVYIRNNIDLQTIIKRIRAL